MSKPDTQSTIPISAVLEDLLSAAGVEFSVVDRCPHPDCDVCTDRELVAAA